MKKHSAKMRVVVVVGARPNIMKAKPVVDALEARGALEVLLLHTGQHYDDALSTALSAQLGLREPNVQLGAGRGPRLEVPELIGAFAAWCRAQTPDAVIVLGDVDSTRACAVAAHAVSVPLIHVEAGLRSFDRAMPEEVNRVVTDALSGLLLVSDPAGVTNLEREGRSGEAVQLVGNVMIDTLLANLDRARAHPLPARVRAVTDAGEFALLTLHRPSNVDTREALERWIDALRPVCALRPVVFPVHPRTRASLERHGLTDLVQRVRGLLLTEPLGYLETIRLQDAATFVMTDSGGVQEESSVLKTPCMTLRTTTERPVTVSHGTAVLVHEDPALLLSSVTDVLEGRFRGGAGIPLWDGQAGGRVADAVARFLGAT